MTPSDLVQESAPPNRVDSAAEPVRLGRKRDHTRDPEILAAALEVLAESGYEGMTVDMVARRAKAGKATVYRRWPSKAELVLEAVSCIKLWESPLDDPPDTGTLRGDLVAMIRPHSLEESERELKVIGGLVSMMSRDPHLAEAVNEAIMEPRARLNEALMQRAIDRGEVAPDVDTKAISYIGPSMTAYRSLVQRKPVDREFLMTMIDEIVLPALGIGR